MLAFQAGVAIISVSTNYLALYNNLLMLTRLNGSAGIGHLQTTLFYINFHEKNKAFFIIEILEEISQSLAYTCPVFCIFSVLKGQENCGDQIRTDQTRPDQTKPDPEMTRPDQTRQNQTRPDLSRPDLN
jgi:hypothetical protein